MTREGASRFILAARRGLAKRCNPIALSHMEPPCMTEETRDRHSVDPKLLEILVCPVTKGPLEYDAEKQELISRAAKLAYPIRDGIPIMLPEEARQLE